MGKHQPRARPPVFGTPRPSALSHADTFQGIYLRGRKVVSHRGAGRGFLRRRRLRALAERHERLRAGNSSTSLNITGALTLEAWIKYNTNGTYQEIIARESYGQTGGGYALQITNTGKLRFILYQGGTAYVAVVGATTLSAGVWHHVAGVFDGASQRRVYLDGVEDGSASSAGSAPTSGTANLQIGRLSSNSLYL